MSVTSVDRRTGPRTWEKTSTPTTTGATLYRYRDGLLVGMTTAIKWEIELGPGESGYFEVTDHPWETPGIGLPGRLEFHWSGESDAHHYRVEEQVDGEWVSRGEIHHSTDGLFRYTTRYLDDETTYYFRTIGVTTDGVEGVPRLITALMARRPDPPSVQVAWTAETAVLTIDTV